MLTIPCFANVVVTYVFGVVVSGYPSLPGADGHVHGGHLAMNPQPVTGAAAFQEQQYVNNQQFVNSGHYLMNGGLVYPVQQPVINHQLVNNGHHYHGGFAAAQNAPGMAFAQMQAPTMHNPPTQAVPQQAMVPQVRESLKATYYIGVSHS